MDRRATIKDIAQQAGVSISSVHLALSGKEGVSEATRERIQAIASELNYRPNILASSLKRDIRRVAVVLPPRDYDSKYFYDFMWKAIEDYAHTAGDYNLEFQTFTCTDGYIDQKGYDISQFSGIILITTIDALNPAYGEEVRRLNIPVVLVDSDRTESDRFCCVEADASEIGSLTEELLEMTVRNIQGKILIAGAGPSLRNRDLTKQAIHSAFEGRGIRPSYLELDLDNAGEESIKAIEKTISENNISGACALNSRTTNILCQAIERTGKKDCFPVIGSGVFEESKTYLKDGLLTAIIDKNPYEQCTRALEIMTDYLTRDIVPPTDKIAVNIHVAFRSTVDQIY